MRNQTTIAAEVAALEAIKPRVRCRTMFGDDNRAAIEAQILVLQSEDPAGAANDFELESDHEFQAAYEALTWLNEDDVASLAESWAELVVDMPDEKQRI